MLNGKDSARGWCTGNLSPHQITVSQSFLFSILLKEKGVERCLQFNVINILSFWAEQFIDCHCHYWMLNSFTQQNKIQCKCKILSCSHILLFCHSQGKLISQIILTPRLANHWPNYGHRLNVYKCLNNHKTLWDNDFMLKSHCSSRDLTCKKCECHLPCKLMDYIILVH